MYEDKKEYGQSAYGKKNKGKWIAIYIIAAIIIYGLVYVLVIKKNSGGYGSSTGSSGSLYNY